MADWYEIDLEFLDGPLNKDQVEQLHKILESEDYDFPTLTPLGLDKELWRSPTISIKEVLDICQGLGYNCRARMRPQIAWHDESSDRHYCPDCGNWQYSKE